MFHRMQERKLELSSIRVLTLFVLLSVCVSGHSQTEGTFPWMRGAYLGVINDVAWVPYSNKIVSVGVDNTLKIWDAFTGNLLKSVRASASCLAVSSDGRQVATGGESRVVRVYNLEDGRLVSQSSPLPTSISSIAFSPNSNLVAVSLNSSEQFFLLNPQNGTVVFNHSFHRQVQHISFSEDGSKLMIAYLSGIMIWDMQTLTPVYNYPLANTCFRAYFLPGGQHIIFVTTNRVVSVLRITDDTIVNNWSSGTSSLIEMNVSADGAFAATVHQSGFVYIWRIEDGSLIQTIWSWAAKRISFSFIEPKVALASTDNLRIYNVIAEPQAHLTPYSNSNNDFAIAANSSRMAVAARDNTVQIWDLQNRTVLCTFVPPSGSFQTVVFSPDGSLVATNGSETISRIWDASTGQLLRTVNGRILQFSYDNQYVITQVFEGNNGFIKIWRTETGVLERTIAGEATFLSVSPDSRQLAGAKNNRITVWDFQTGAVLQSWTPAGNNNIIELKFSPDGSKLGCSVTNYIYLYDVPTWRLIRSFYETSLGRFQFSKDNRHLFVRFSLSSARCVYRIDMHTGIWQGNYAPDTNLFWVVEMGSQEFIVSTLNSNPSLILLVPVTPKLNRILVAPTFGQSRIAYSKNGRYIATRGNGITTNINTVTYIWDAVEGQLLHHLTGQNGTISDIAFSQENHFASISTNAALWSVQNDGLRLIDLWGETDSSVTFTRCAFAPSDSILATLSSNNWLRLWRYPSPTLLHSFQISGSNQSMIFSPDSNRVAIVTGSIVSIFDAFTGALLRSFTAQSSSPKIAFSPDGSMLLSADSSGAISLWNVFTGTQIVNLSTSYSFQSAAFAPSGRHFALGSTDERVRIWSLQGEIMHTYDQECNNGVATLAFSPNGQYLVWGRHDGSLVKARNPLWFYGDFNGDGCVDDIDLLLVLFSYGSDNPNTDYDGDRLTDDTELLLVLFRFGEGC